ncbi:hypothetical protein NliqN6_2960 [Naganishia liquefaciens]|uniref:Arf-GAP domain-containing protein n=1 Tax=Naganishia liquefaciens TaxID=104408 RepID=A0A8H3YES1_9TREE|nr:hypothetical protein NliqN6_2960 [Naganishia liquefaciens]
MADASYKKQLRELMALPENKKCVDCGAPSPQWASVQHGTLICLECSGIHRSFGVHISFVRSVTMDKWTEEQLRKMRVGGNANFTAFCEAYDPKEGGYPPASEREKIVNNAEGMNGGGGLSAGGASAGAEKGRVMKQKYGSWAVAQYREKLAAETADEPTEWTSSAPPATFVNLLTASAPGPASATRARGGRNSPMPPSVSSNTSTGRSASPMTTSGGGNEDFFAGLGEANAKRRDDVPPSQGGKYTGFGSAPDPPQSAGAVHHPSYALSSHAAPSLDEFQTAPLAALTKSWGLFSSAVTSAGKEIHESVVKPGMARAGQTLGEFQAQQQAQAQGPGQGPGYGVKDPREMADRLSSQARSTGGWLSSMAGEGWQNLNTLAREKGGVDLSAKLGQLGLGGRGTSGGNATRGYPRGYEYGDAYADDGRDAAYRDDGAHGKDGWAEWDAPAPASAPVKPQSSTSKAAPKTDKAWDDEWKDF